MSNNGTTFSSTLQVAPGVEIFLNDPANWSNGADWTSGLEYNPSSEVTPDQLKAYLDGFATSSGGWSLGTTPVSIGLLFDIPNDAVGLGSDPSSREFLLNQDETSTIYASAATVPELGTLGLSGLVLLPSMGFLAWRSRRR